MAHTNAPANPADKPLTGAALASALNLIACLPLSDDERAELVRRLLGR